MLSHDGDRFVRIGVAYNPSAPAEVLAELALEKSALLRQAVASNRSTPVDVLIRLACDENPDVSEAGAATLSSFDDAGCRLAAALAVPGLPVADLVGFVAAAGVDGSLVDLTGSQHSTGQVLDGSGVRPSSITVVAWNVLADSYFYPYPDRYRHLSPLPDPLWRRAAVCDVVEAFAVDADVFGLLECDGLLADAVRFRLEPLGWEVRWSQRSATRSDGTLVAARTASAPAFDEVRCRTGDFVAGVVSLASEFTVVFTHIGWAPSGTSADDHVGAAQVGALLEGLCSESFADGAIVVAGDFNTSDLEEPPLATLAAASFDLRFPNGFTAAVNGERLERLDGFAAVGAYVDEPVLLMPVPDDAHLPSLECPSDHVPVSARVWW